MPTFLIALRSFTQYFLQPCDHDAVADSRNKAGFFFFSFIPFAQMLNCKGEAGGGLLLVAGGSANVEEFRKEMNIFCHLIC